MAKVTLYDLPSRDPCACWSLNPWKSRLQLNYKGVDYDTEWVEYPDVAPKIKAFGVEQNPPGQMPYTIPTLRLVNGKTETYIMDSAKIAAALEDVFPTPSLHLDSEYLPQMYEHVGECQKYLLPFWMPQVPRKILNPVSAEYFNPMEKSRPGFEKIAALLKTNGGPFVMGNTVSYADFVLVSFLQFLKRANEEAFTKALAVDDVIKKVYEASAKWLERDGH